MRFILALPFLALAVPASALEIGQGYEAARAEILADGWQPANAARDCAGRDDVCDAYPETDLCAPTGSAPCIFRFERGAETLEVSTENELVPDLVVTGWQ